MKPNVWMDGRSEWIFAGCKQRATADTSIIPHIFPLRKIRYSEKKKSDFKISNQLQYVTSITFLMLIESICRILTIQELQEILKSV